MHFTVPLLFSLIPAAAADFHLYYPWWRGDSLALSTYNQSISQSIFPCAPTPSPPSTQPSNHPQAAASAKKPAPPTAPSGP